MCKRNNMMYNNKFKRVTNSRRDISFYSVFKHLTKFDVYVYINNEIFSETRIREGTHETRINVELS